MAKPKELVPVAMEPDHTACEACETCGGSSGYVESVRQALVELGASSPEDLIARHTPLVRRARKAGMSPPNAAGMILAMSGKDPTQYTPRFQLEEPAHASDYVAVDSRGRRVWGPGKDYLEAKRHAQMAGGVVKFEMGAGEAREYEGWKNYETWNVNLWVMNEEPLYRAVVAHPSRFTPESAARFVREAFPRGTPDFQDRGRAAAYGKVDWKEIADSFNEVRGEGRGSSLSLNEPAMAQDDPRLDFYIVSKDTGFAVAGPYWGHVAADNAWAKYPNRDAYQVIGGGFLNDSAFGVFGVRRAVPRGGGWATYMAREARDGKLEDKEAIADHLRAEGHGDDYIRTAIGADAFDKWKATRGAEPDAKLERCVAKVEASGRAVDPWAVCRASLGQEPEPFRNKHIPWHRDGAGYYADVEPYGRIRVKQRDQNKREGRLAWFAVVKKIEVAQGETRAEVNEAVEKHLRNPMYEPASTSEAAEVAIVERSDDAGPGGSRISSPKDLHRLFGERYGRLGSEVFEIVIVNLNDEMIGKPVQVAMGQASGVRVEVEQCMAAAIAGRASGGTGFYALHNHPAGTLRASSADKDLTKRIEAAQKIAAPSMKFHGHYIVTAKGVARA